VIKKYLIAALCIVLFGGGIYLGYRVTRPNTPATQVTSQTVLITLKSEGFLVTQSYVFNQQIDIEHSTGNQWKDIFWKQAIKASANVKVNSGVDLTKLTEKDIEIRDKEILVTLPQVTVNSTEILGDVMVQNNQGIFKRAFDNDDGYNQALTAIKAEALEAATKDEVMSEARASAEKQVKQLVRYVYPDREVVVSFK
jgi:hypothetical protein